MPEEIVFDECDHRIVNSGHAPTTKYRVSLGTANWDSQRRTAIVIIMQYEGMPHWKMPAHVLLDDLPAVLTAMGQLLQAGMEGRPDQPKSMRPPKHERYPNATAIM
jgi:hypothetical protein